MMLSAAKKILFACLLTIFGFFINSAHADWDVISFNDDMSVIIYVDNGSIHYSNSSIFAWLIYDRENPAENGALSAKSLNEYDCEQQLWRTWRKSLFDQKMAKGTRLNNDEQKLCEAGDSQDIVLNKQCEKPWQSVGPGSVGADIIKILCKSKSI